MEMTNRSHRCDMDNNILIIILNIVSQHNDAYMQVTLKQYLKLSSLIS